MKLLDRPVPPRKMPNENLKSANQKLELMFESLYRQDKLLDELKDLQVQMIQQVQDLKSFQEFND